MKKTLSLPSRLAAHAIRGLMLGLVLAGASFSAHALKTDKDQPATIDADNIDMDFKTGKRTYSGNVTIVQGSMRLKANKVVVRMRDGAVTNAMAYGNPAVFKQRPDGKKEDVIGKSKKMELDYPTNTVHMLGGATLTQGRDTTRGAAIHYNMTTDRMKIEGGTSSVKAAPKKPGGAAQPAVSSNAATGRAKMVIPLKKKQPALPPTGDSGAKAGATDAEADKASPEAAGSASQ